jgi:hypothetical protein
LKEIVHLFSKWLIDFFPLTIVVFSLMISALQVGAVVAPIGILIEISNLIVFPGQQDTGPVEGAVLGQVLIVFEISRRCRLIEL